jgi:hypothetical protein
MCSSRRKKALRDDSGRRSHVSVEAQTSPRSCCCERRWIVSGSRSRRPLSKSAVLVKFRDLP